MSQIVYRVRETGSGAFIKKYNDSESEDYTGFVLSPRGSVWKSISHIKSSLKRGVLFRAIQKFGKDSLEICEFALEERPTGKTWAIGKDV